MYHISYLVIVTNTMKCHINVQRITECFGNKSLPLHVQEFHSPLQNLTLKEFTFSLHCFKYANKLHPNSNR